MGSGWGAPVPAGRGSPGSPRCGSRRTPLSASRAGASPGGTALPERPRCAPLSRGLRPEKLRGDPTRASAWEGGGGCARWPPHPAPRLARGRAALGGSATGRGKKIRPGGRVLKNIQQNAVSGRFRFHFCFPLPQPCPHPACPASVLGPRLGPRRLRLSRCREAARRVDPHPSPGERGQVCR